MSLERVDNAKKAELVRGDFIYKNMVTHLEAGTFEHDDGDFVYSLKLNGNSYFFDEKSWVSFVSGAVEQLSALKSTERNRMLGEEILKSIESDSIQSN